MFFPPAKLHFKDFAALFARPRRCLPRSPPPTVSSRAKRRFVTYGDLWSRFPVVRVEKCSEIPERSGLARRKRKNEQGPRKIYMYIYTYISVSLRVADPRTPFKTTDRLISPPLGRSLPLSSISRRRFFLSSDENEQRRKNFWGDDDDFRCHLNDVRPLADVIAARRDDGAATRINDDPHGDVEERGRRTGSVPTAGRENGFVDPPGNPADDTCRTRVIRGQRGRRKARRRRILGSRLEAIIGDCAWRSAGRDVAGFVLSRIDFTN